MKKRFTKAQLVQHPLVQSALKELGISPRRLKLSYVPGNPTYRRGLSYPLGYAVIRVNTCVNFNELIWVTLHEIRHLWQFRRRKVFDYIDEQELVVVRALSKAHSVSAAEVMNSRFHDMLPTEVDANIYATLKLGLDFSTYTMYQENN